MDGDPVDLLGDELYRANPRWRVTRIWRFTHGHPSIHATALVGVIPTRDSWFACLRGTATELGSEAAGVGAAQQMMTANDGLMRQRLTVYDDNGDAAGWVLATQQADVQCSWPTSGDPEGVG